MKDLEREGIGAVVIFCEEIREEMHGKSIMIGVFPGYEMTFPTGAIPCLLPKFALCLKYYENKSTFPTFKNIKVFAPKIINPIIDFSIDDLTIQQGINSATDELPLCGYTLNITMSPLPIASEGKIMVYGYNDDCRIRLGTMKVKIDPNLTQPTIALNPLLPQPLKSN